MPKPICPYCGLAAPSADTTKCDACGGLFEPLSRTATQLAMGPWFVRDEARPFMPGFNTDILRQQVRAGRITPKTIVRGPSTHQFWMRAGEVPGLSRLLGRCHACGQNVSQDDTACSGCQADLSLPEAVDTLGLSLVDAQARAKAQAQVAAQRNAPPKAPPQQDAKPTKAKAQPQLVDPSLMTPIEELAVEDDPAAGSAAHEPRQEHSAAAEDIWHTGSPAPARRRRKRKSGPDPLVMAMGALFLLLVVGGGLVLLSSAGGSGDAADAGNGADPGASNMAHRYTADQVTALSEQALADYRPLVEEGVAAPLADRLAQITRLMDKAAFDRLAERHDDAYEGFVQARQQIGELVTAQEAWRVQQAALKEVTGVRERVSALRRRAAEAGAERWSGPAWASGEALWSRAEPLIAAGELKRAVQLLTEAQPHYEDALDRAARAKVADTARQAMLARMKAGSSEKALREGVPGLFELFLKQQQEADRLLAAGAFEDAQRSFTQAAEAIDRANRALEFARYTRFYALQAGSQAAGLMLDLASGQTLEPAALSAMAQAYEQLGLASNPAANLRPGGSLDMDSLTQALVFEAREAVGRTRGAQGQACYLAGFHMQIIDRTLGTPALSAEQQKRVHQSLGVIETQAELAGWDTDALRPVAEAVRDANRKARIGEDPSQTRGAWARLRGPLSDREAAGRIIDPGRFPSTPADPELFPQAGS